MDTVSAEHFVADQFPRALQSLIPTTLKTAYDQAAIIAKSDPVFQIESAVDNRGRLITWTVDFAFKRAIESGKLPFDFRWRPFAKPTGRYLEIRLSHSVATISQIADPKHQPRNVVFRQNKRLNNEPFFDLDEFRDEREVHGLPHFIIAHGHQDLSFAHIGVPHAVHQRDWIYRTPNLMQMPYALPEETLPIEDTDFDATMELRDEIEKWRRDNGE